MRAIIYCRKSTDRIDMQVQSLDIQEEWATNYCKNMNMEVIELIAESKSASKVTGREGFGRVVEHFEVGTADTLVVYNIDRIARNPLDEGNIKWLAQQGKIKQIHSPQGVFDGRQILVLSLHMAMANQYTIDLSARVSDGKRKKVENGKISWRAPLGYLNDKNTDSILIKNDEAIYIKRIFEMRSEKHSVELITSQIYNEGFRTKKGKKVSRTVVERIIANPFYYGIILYQNEMYKGVHEPLVSKQLWDKANNNKRGVILVQDRYLSPLKGIVRHHESKEEMTVSLIKKKYVYFHLHHRKNKEKKIWYPQNNIIKDFSENIEFYCVPEEFKEDLKTAIYEESGLRMNNNDKEKIVIKGKITKLEKEKKGLIKMRRVGELTGDEFLEEKNRIVDAIEEYETKLIDLNRNDDHILSNLNNMVELFVELINIWKTAENMKNARAYLKNGGRTRNGRQKKALYSGKSTI